MSERFTEQQRETTRTQTQSKTKAVERPAMRTTERPAARTADRPAQRDVSQPLAKSGTQAASTHQQSLSMEEAIVTAGHAGEQNITIEFYWAEVEGHRPCGFNVVTHEGHGLDVLVEQRSYRKSYTGTGSLKTGLVPIAPIGTKGRVLVTDTTTGETREQPFTWYRIGGWSLSNVWRAIKRLFWKG